MKMDRFERLLYLLDAATGRFLAEVGKEQGEMLKDPLVLSVMTVRAAILKLYRQPQLDQPGKKVKEVAFEHVKSHKKQLKRMIARVEEILKPKKVKA